MRLEDTGSRNQCSRYFFISRKFIPLTVTFQSCLNPSHHCRSTIPAAAIVSRAVRTTLAETPHSIALEIANLERFPGEPRQAFHRGINECPRIVLPVEGSELFLAGFRLPL